MRNTNSLQRINLHCLFSLSLILHRHRILQEGHFRFVHDAMTWNKETRPFQKENNRARNKTWLLNKQLGCYTLLEHERLKNVSNEKKIHFRISLRIKTFHFNFPTPSRLWWRSHTVHMQSSESRHLESFVDLLAVLEYTPTFHHTSTSSRKLCGPRLFTLSLLFRSLSTNDNDDKCCDGKYIQILEFCARAICVWFVVKECSAKLSP